MNMKPRAMLQDLRILIEFHVYAGPDDDSIPVVYYGSTAVIRIRVVMCSLLRENVFLKVHVISCVQSDINSLIAKCMLVQGIPFIV